MHKKGNELYDKRCDYPSLGLKEGLCGIIEGERPDGGDKLIQIVAHELSCVWIFLVDDGFECFYYIFREVEQRSDEKCAE